RPAASPPALHAALPILSTDYDVSGRLYFEPLTLENVLAVVEKEHPVGVIVQLVGQTPLSLARGLEEAGVKLLGTGWDAIDRAEKDRKSTRLNSSHRTIS